MVIVAGPSLSLRNHNVGSPVLGRGAALPESKVGDAERMGVAVGAPVGVPSLARVGR